MKHLKMSEEEAYALVKKSVELAQTAADRYIEEFPEASKTVNVVTILNQN